MSTPEKPHFSTRYVGVPTSDDSSSALAASVDENTQYRSNSAFPQDQQVDLTSHPQLHGKRSWVKTFIIQGFSILWLVPIVALLWLNLKGHVIGASAWCPGGNCYPQVFNPISSITQEHVAKYDSHNHNLLGALQLVAKALEIWFILICGWLMYRITMHIAGRKEGLPIAYLTRPIEFSELAGLLDPLLWRTLPKLRKSGQRRARKRVWALVFGSVMLGLLCNLMGPAVAVLVLPTLQWLETEKVEPYAFTKLNSDRPPSTKPDGFIRRYGNCTEEQLDNQQYSCASTPWATTMDAWIESFVASVNAVNGITQQDLLSFQFNATGWALPDGTIIDWLSWAPSRQMLQALSNDYFAVMNMSLGATRDDFLYPTQFDTYAPINNTVQSFVQRTGPILGVASTIWYGYDNATWFDVQVKENQMIRCFKGYDVTNSPLAPGFLTGNYTKCVKHGRGWDNGYQRYIFEIDGMYKPWIDNLGPSAAFQIWTSDKAAFLPDGQLPPGFPSECLPEDGTVPSSANCDWDAFFTVTEDDPMHSRSSMTNTIQIDSHYADAEGHPSTVTLMFDFVAFLNFTTYSFDPSPLSNPLSLATTPNLPFSGKPLFVDPSWTLAAWSADSGGTVGSNRSSTLQMLKLIDRLWSTEIYEHPDPLTALYPEVDYMALLPIIQTLSLIEYEATLLESLPAGVTPPDATEDNPRLYRNARINVWAFGVGSRTSQLGVAVAFLGVAVVLLQVLLGCIDRRPYRSPTELLVAALEHSPLGEFHGKEHNERAIAKIPFRVEDKYESGGAGRFKFQKSW